MGPSIWNYLRLDLFAPSSQFDDVPRVSLVLSELRPGGMERVVVHLANGLARRNVGVLVICLQDPGMLAMELGNENVELIALKSFSGRDLGAVWRLRTALARFRPSVVHVHDYASLPYAAIANLLATRAPLLFTGHGLLYEGFEGVRRRNAFFARFLSGLSAVSDKVAQRHREYLDWRKPLATIANGVPPAAGEGKLRQATRDQLGCPADRFLFLAVGNPRPEKGFEDLVDAVALLRERKGSAVGFQVAVAGTLADSDYCRMLADRVEEQQVGDCCTFLGFRQDTAALYAAADAFVLSSRSEGLPMVILEAMMAGLPVVATKVGGIPDAVGEHVLLTDPAQPAQLADAMERVMEEPSLAEKFGSDGQRYVEKTFGVERMVDDYLGWYGTFRTKD